LTALVWFRRDLRVEDHPALYAAAERHDRVVPVYCLDDRILAGRHASGPRTRFLLESLHELRDQTGRLGSRLVVARERPEQALVALARRTGADEVYYTRDVSPLARARDAGVHAALDEASIRGAGFPGLCVVEDVGALHTRKGGPYTVFTPFYRTWGDTPRRRPLPAPDRLTGVSGLRIGTIPTLRSLGLDEEVEDPMAGGAQAGNDRLARFLGGPVHRYIEDHDNPAVDGTSKLSPYLHFGCVSPRAVEAALPDGEGPDAFRRQLCWRDFYHHVLLHYPDNSRYEFQPRYRGTLRWTGDDGAFEAWAAGRTGFPLVDAGMRQLRREGWMHNRIRLVVASFLTKHLGIDWRRGEAWFMRLLLDGDQASNNGNWQWTASVGVDPQPLFRRIYNPTLHARRYDPDGVYVRAYVPELARVPEEFLAEPWRMPEHAQHAAGCRIGVDYPAPIIDLGVGRAETIGRYAAAK
jgi:deoxyribodipyrimidine photo-lyase